MHAGGRSAPAPRHARNRAARGCPGRPFRHQPRIATLGALLAGLDGHRYAALRLKRRSNLLLPALQRAADLGSVVTAREHAGRSSSVGSWTPLSGLAHRRRLHAGQPLEADLLQQRLGASLPHYMVPTAVQWLEQLSLTTNSKIDSKARTRVHPAPGPAAGQGWFFAAPVPATIPQLLADPLGDPQ